MDDNKKSNRSIIKFFLCFIVSLSFGTICAVSIFDELDSKYSLSCSNYDYCIYNRYKIGIKTKSVQLNFSDIYKLQKNYHLIGGRHGIVGGNYSYDVYMYPDNIIDLKSERLFNHLNSYRLYSILKKNNINNETQLYEELPNLSYEQLESEYSDGLNILDSDSKEKIDFYKQVKNILNIIVFSLVAIVLFLSAFTFL